MKGFFKSFVVWQICLLVGVLLIFVVGGWYAFMYEGDSLTAKYAAIIVAVVGIFFMVASYISWNKKRKDNDTRTD